jgi:hypothetical protein
MMTDKKSIPSCYSLVQQIDRWFAVLRQCEVDVPTSASDCFSRCSACSSRKVKKTDLCQGGSLKIDANTPIRFVSSHDGRSVTVTVTAATQYSSSPGFPKKHSVEVEVSHENEPTKYRAHLDLAVESSREPLFHLQSGGFRGENLVGEKYFGDLRWPIFPMDLVLVTELVLYTFQPEKWESVHRDAEFLYAVRPSEERFLAPFFQHWSNPQTRNHSFLATFCASRQGWLQKKNNSPSSKPRRKK